MKVCHIISGHDTNDVRVFQKQCVSLAEHGHDVTLLCSDGLPDREIKNVKIVSVNKIPKGRISRFLFSTKKFYKKALEIDADVYQLHEPFLLKTGKKLKKRGKKVIFDSHEDYPSLILDKPYIPKGFRKILSKSYERREKSCVSKFDAVIGVTPRIVNRLRKYNPNAVMITNVPILEHLAEPTFNSRQIIFPGLVEKMWRVDSVVKAIGDIEDITFLIRTRNSDSAYMDELKCLPGWSRVDFGRDATHDEVMQLVSKSYCGIAIADYCPELGGKEGTLGCTKLFEYMMAGIPVICTDFILWKELIEEYKCGICVAPDDVEGIRNAIQYFFDNKDMAYEMGANGRKAVVDKFNWQVEANKLFELYDSLNT